MSSFSRTVAAVVGALLLLTMVAGATSMSRGPQQQGISFDSEALTQLQGQRILLTGNQALSDSSAEGVVLDPPAEFRASVEGSTLVIELTQLLRFRQEYRIVAAGVRGVSTPATADWAASVTTADGNLLFAQPGDGGIDILQTSAHDVRAETVIRSLVPDPGAEITALLDLGTAAAAIVSPSPEGGSALIIAPLDGSPPNTVRLPVRGWVSALVFDPVEARLEFDVTPVAADSSAVPERWGISTTNTLAAERVASSEDAVPDAKPRTTEAPPETRGPAGTALESIDNRVVNGAGQIVYTPADEALRIAAVCPSANGQFAAVRLEPRVPGEPSAADAATSYVVIAADGTSVRSISATAVSWCAEPHRG
ncbi:hypothetical protein [Lysinibacter cavernae]|uniref:SbsA Ig-like domain-containing protein n=1 Tax=Lysinibacter cavernae TaxID=1640652 RepID=A0A7X5R0P2_9MICO|nr:hypothetical protein [Lysinibacter cavernae]NIH53297.1 hypothetical protein [Lysinibacter cavernae]